MIEIQFSFFIIVLLEVLPVEIFDMTWWIRIRDVIKTKKNLWKIKTLEIVEMSLYHDC